MNKRGHILLLALLVVLFIIINYNFLDKQTTDFLDESEFVTVGRIIDGDTIVVDNDTHVRLLGINTPEKREFYYQGAKDFLANLILNKTVKLEYGKEKQDLYGRTLAYIVLDDKNINAEIVRSGFANTYIYDTDKYTNELKQAWDECIAKKINLCMDSKDKCAQCIELKELNVKDQTVILYNKCDFDCNLYNWNIKDEGRKRFVFPDFILGNEEEIKIIVSNKTSDESVFYWTGESYVWTSTGDTLFLRDKEGGLVLWKRY
jgi:micrococcal nuclease